MALVLTVAPAYRPFPSWGHLSGHVRSHNSWVWQVLYNNFPGAWNVGYGVGALNSWLLAGWPKPYHIYGHDLGAQVICRWLREFGPTTTLDPTDVTFYLSGNPERKYNGWPKGGEYPGFHDHPRGRDGVNDPGGSGIPGNTPFRVYDIARQYDEVADFPNDTTNVDAMLNIDASKALGSGPHKDYSAVDLASEANSTFDEGNVTYLWSPTLVLPLALKYASPDAVTEADTYHREIVEEAYNRPAVGQTLTFDTIFLVPGTSGSPWAMTSMLEGQVTDGQMTEQVFYQNAPTDYVTNVPAGAAILNGALLAREGKKTVFAHSLGAVVACYWLQEYGPTSTIPTSDLDFLLIGNPVRKYNGYYPLHGFEVGHGLGADVTPDGTVMPTIDITGTAYTVVDMALQYDGWADWPNLVDSGHPADLAAWGSWTHHLLYTAYPRDREDYLQYVEGNVTYVLIPNSGGNDPAAEVGYDRVTGAPGGD